MEAFGAGLAPFPYDVAARVGDGDEDGAAVVGAAHAAYEPLLLQALDELGHGGLGDAAVAREHGEPRRSRTGEPAQCHGGGEADVVHRQVPY